MTPALPPALTAALDAMLEGVARKDLAGRAEKLSAAYRKGESSGGITAPLDALAYALARMPATGAALAAVFEAVTVACPGFAPASLLDVGAGPGTASWMATTAWPGITHVTMLDHNVALRTLAGQLAQRGPQAMAQAQIVAADLSAAKMQAELVVASYVLAELPEKRAADVARDLWQAAAQALVLVEPGTPQGFARIRAARAALIAEGAHVAAPCTHDAECPLAGEDWCHFSQRLSRSRDHMQLKGASVPFEDERYAYVAVMRDAVPHRAARILAQPLEAKPGITFKLCDGDGLRAQFVPARDKDATRRARKLVWGDLFEV